MNDTLIIDIDQTEGTHRMKNAIAVLVLGIISIPSCFCYGILGPILGIIALGLSKTEWAAYRVEPTLFYPSDVSNMKAGRICAIIGLVLGGLFFLAVLLIVFFGAMAPQIFENLSF